VDVNQTDQAVNHRRVEQLDYTVPRLTVPIPAVREFQKRYETAVPDLPLAAVADLVSRRAPWSGMVELIERSAPHGFLIYFRNEVHPVMALAGDYLLAVTSGASPRDEAAIARTAARLTGLQESAERNAAQPINDENFERFFGYRGTARRNT